MHISPAVDHHVHDVPMFPWLTFQHCRRPLDSAVAFDYSAMDAVVVFVMVALHVALVAHTVDTSLDHDVVHVDSVDLVADAFPAVEEMKIIKHSNSSARFGYMV